MTVPVWPLQASGLMYGLSFDGRTIRVFRGRKQVNAIDASAITRLKAKRATRLVNGSVEIYFPAGVAAMVVYTRKHQAEFDQIVAAIQAVPPAPAPAAPVDLLWSAAVVQESESAERANHATYRAMTWAVRLEFVSMMLVLVPTGLCIVASIVFTIYVALR